MVGVFKGVVDGGVMTSPYVATEKDVVDAHGEASGVESDSESVAALNEGARECMGKEAMGVGDGRFVEVATEDDGPWCPTTDYVVDAVGLRGPIGGGFGEQTHDG